VLALAPAFEPAVRRAVRATLRALASDPLTDDATRVDVVAMLCATEPVRALQPGRAGRDAASGMSGAGVRYLSVFR
jgi:hypothetical protein